MTLEKGINLLLEIENLITTNYLALYMGESLNKVNSLEYETCFQELIELTKKETKIISSLVNLYSVNSLKQELLNRKVSKREIPLSLGHLTDAEVFRLLHIIDNISGDELLEYASTLKTDIDNLLLAFLEELINNPYYADIRNNLILYRYNLIYMNMELENSFFNDMLSTEVSLEASKYRTAEVPSYIFVDKTILVLESLDYIDYIKSHDGEENPNSQSLIIISIINILTRLTLCEEETLSLIYDDLTDLLTSEDLTFTTKKLINDMQDILKNMHFDWAR